MVTSTPRRMSPTARRDALLDAAEQVLREHVLADLSFELVAEQAGVSKSLPYRYFESPAEIASALYTRLVGTIDATIDGIVATSVGFDDKLSATLDLWCDAIATDGQLVATLLDGKAVAAVQPLIAARDAHARRVWRSAIVDEFGVSPADAALLATMITAAATEALRHWSARDLDRKQFIDDFVRAVRAMIHEFTPR